MALSHIFSSPIADGTNTQLVRPSNWNSVHNEFLTLTGNTSGVSALSGTNIVFEGGNNITLSGTGQTMVISAANQTAGLHASQIAVYGNYSADADVQHMFNEGLWAGWIKGGAISTAAGSTITVGTGEGWFRTADDPAARIAYCSWDSATGSVPNNGVRYVFADYNAGTPVISVATTQTTSPHMQIYVGEAHNPGVLEAHFDPRPAGDFGRRLIDWSSGLIGTRVVSGDVVTDPTSPSRKIKVTADDFWDRHYLNYISAGVDTSGAGVFILVYRNGAGEWVRTGSQTDWPNTQYDNGSGTLNGVTAGWYSNVWVLRSFTGTIYVQYGWAEYATLAEALAEGSPNDRPEELHEHGFYISRITFQASDASPQAITDFRPRIGITGSGGGAAGGAADGVNILAAGSQTATTNGTVLFQNSNGVTFGMSNNSVITASVQTNYQAPGAYLTTAMASNRGSDFIQATAGFAGTNASGTIGSNGLSISVGNYITTAAMSNHSHGNPTLALTNLTGTTASASNGLTISLSAAAPAAGVGIAAGTRTATTAGNLLFDTGNGITFGLNAVGGSIMTASHNGLTTAMASNYGSNFMGLNSAITQNGVSMTANSSGLSLNFPAFLTTAAQSGHSHGNPTLALTNLLGTTASASNGLTISLSVNAGGGDGYNIVQAGSVGTTGTTWSAQSATIGLNGSNGIIVSQNNSNQIVFEGSNLAALTHSHGNPTLALTNLTGTTASASNGFTISLSAAAPGGGVGVTVPGYNHFDNCVQVVGQVGQGSLLFNPMMLPNVSFDRFQMFLQNTNSSNSSGSHTLRFTVGLYTQNASTLSLYSSFGGSTALVHSGTAGSYSWYSGKRMWPMTFAAVSVPENKYWMGFVSSTASGGANGTYSNYQMSDLNSNFTGLWGAASNATMQPELGKGFYTATTTGMPASVAFSQIQGTNSLAMRPPIIIFGSGTA